MTRHGRTLLLLVALVFGIAETGNAACAWVLWGHRTDDVYQPIGDALKSLDDCLDMADRLTKRDVKRIFNFSCLPDTIDPRGPKGK